VQTAAIAAANRIDLMKWKDITPEGLGTPTGNVWTREGGRWFQSAGSAIT